MGEPGRLARGSQRWEFLPEASVKNIKVARPCVERGALFGFVSTTVVNRCHAAGYAALLVARRDPRGAC
jgi:hypothetical protein